MSDRTNFQVYVYECPEDQHDAAVDAIREVAGEWEEGSADDLAAGLIMYDARCGIAGEMAAALAEAVPGASFYLWEDPAYEWLGDVYAYTPALGMFTAECDSNGEPMFRLSDVLATIGTANGDAEAVKRAMGGPWREDWSAHCCTPAPIAAK